MTFSLPGAAVTSLPHFLWTWACNNRWANHRLLQACGQLGQDAFTARRTGFFPSIAATLNHIVTVDWYYVDAMERSLRGQPPNEAWRAYFDPEQPFSTCPALAAAQQAVDERLIALCRSLDEASVTSTVNVPREGRLCPERMHRLLAHLFEHQIHHRGQVHAMLAGTSVAPPQLDEFFCESDAEVRKGDFGVLGWSEEMVWKEGTVPGTDAVKDR
ncbi:DinB family protein [Aquabacterium sp. A7-Y]|uniref:DinB family protein n=1 Tax=Aquabacterium sp. A7-Y TaxID=1349605 RepID=UPI00223DAA8A|nr:DinB family protein [Aquabacterium sp. A7-Y]MCW7538402.1 DinB family protein [Aquabacterium sp. A7-Y]